MAGVNLAVRAILRLEVDLLRVRITVEQILALGPTPVLTVVAAVSLTILVGWLVARLLGLERDLGPLTGGVVAICGASAALALSAVMPRHDTAERATILTVVGVTTLSMVAMVTYPLIVGALGLDYAEAGDVSTFVKLLRVAMLVPAVLCFSLLFRRSRGEEGAAKVTALPGFPVAFVVLVLVLVNSVGLVPPLLVEGFTFLSRWCLITAIAALGIKTSFQKLAAVGWKPVVMMVAKTVFLALLVLGVVLLAGVAG